MPISSMLGALPGCGGAVVVITAYNSKRNDGCSSCCTHLNNGDAAFLLIAKRPDTALFLLPFCWLIGTGFGYLIDIFYHTELRIR